MLNLLRIVAVSLATYLTLFAVAVISPFVFLVGFWVGMCMFFAVASFFFWLMTHEPSALRATLYFLIWGFPPYLVAGFVGFCEGRLKDRRQARTADAPFSITFNEPDRRF